VNVAPSWRREAQPIVVGARHTVAVRIDGAMLRVVVDGARRKRVPMSSARSVDDVTPRRFAAARTRDLR
jgi:hypothetical protein